MSSRNRRLNKEQRQQAVKISQLLKSVRDQLRPGDLGPLQSEAMKELDAAGFRTDYLSIADATTLQPISVWDGKQALVGLVAAFLGPVRLIDNLPLN